MGLELVVLRLDVVVTHRPLLLAHQAGVVATHHTMIMMILMMIAAVFHVYAWGAARLKCRRRESEIVSEMALGSLKLSNISDYSLGHFLSSRTIPYVCFVEAPWDCECCKFNIQLVYVDFELDSNSITTTTTKKHPWQICIIHACKVSLSS